MNAKQNLYVTQVDVSIEKKLLADLIAQEFEISHPAHTLFSGKKSGISCTLYQSGKLLVQGKEIGPFIEFYLEPEILGSFQYGYEDLQVDTTARIGVDEAGKGDFFGPLCIAGVYGNPESIKNLIKLGVKDSKTLKDPTIIKLAHEIRKVCAHHIVKINPFKYNELYLKFKNLNNLLAWGHATVIENLVQETNCHKVVVDQFAKEHVVETALTRKGIKLDLLQRHRAEEDVVVAAASILARATFVDGIQKLGEQFDIVLPKGASSAVIKMGQHIYAKHGEEGLKQLGKLHFKTFNQIIAKGDYE